MFLVNFISKTGYLLILFQCSFRVPVSRATYSIVATDSETRQVGGAGATCLPGWDVFDALYTASPGRSVLHTQGWLLEDDNPIMVKARTLMDKGDSTPQEILDAMKELDTGTFDDGYVVPEVEIRQYAAADFESTAAYNGPSLADLWDFFGYPPNVTEIADGRVYTGPYKIHAAGNIVQNGTVAALLDGFDDEIASPFGVCDLPGRLMTAMNKVMERGLGDVRCLERKNVSASGGYVHVDNPDGSVLLHINVGGLFFGEPVAALADDFLEWRKNHPCNGEEPGYGLSDATRTFSNLPIFVAVTALVAFAVS